MDSPRELIGVIVGVVGWSIVLGIVISSCDGTTAPRPTPNDLTPTGRLCPPTVVLIPSDSAWYILRHQGTWIQVP